MSNKAAIGVLFQRPYRSLTRFGFLLSPLPVARRSICLSPLARSMAVYSEPLGPSHPADPDPLLPELMRDRSRYMQTLMQLTGTQLSSSGDPHPLHDTFLVEFLLALYVIGVGVAVLKLLHNHLAKPTRDGAYSLDLYSTGAITLLFGAGQAIQ